MSECGKTLIKFVVASVAIGFQAVEVVDGSTDGTVPHVGENHACFLSRLVPIKLASNASLIDQMIHRPWNRMEDLHVKSEAEVEADQLVPPLRKTLSLHPSPESPARAMGLAGSRWAEEFIGSHNG